MSKANGTTKRAAQKDAKGRFLPGNKMGRGNPLVKFVIARKKAFYEATTNDDIKLATQELLDFATGQKEIAPAVQLAAIRLLFEMLKLNKEDREQDPEGAEADEEIMRTHVRELMKIPGVADAIEAETVR